jgi:hypothetical protein
MPRHRSWVLTVDTSSTCMLPLAIAASRTYSLPPFPLLDARGESRSEAHTRQAGQTIAGRGPRNPPLSNVSTDHLKMAKNSNPETTGERDRWPRVPWTAPLPMLWISSDLGFCLVANHELLATAMGWVLRYPAGDANEQASTCSMRCSTSTVLRYACSSVQ